LSLFTLHSSLVTAAKRLPWREAKRAGGLGRGAERGGEDEKDREDSFHGRDGRRGNRGMEQKKRQAEFHENKELNHSDFHETKKLNHRVFHENKGLTGKD